MITNILKGLAYTVKFIRLPHLMKYPLFLLLKNRNVFVQSKLEISRASLQLNLGDFIEYWVFMDGLYEGPWVKYAKKLVKGKTFIDVGANIGVYSLSLHKHATMVHAFEPETTNYNRLTTNIKTNDIRNIKSYKNAVYSKENLQIKLYVSKEDKGWHSLTIPFPGSEQMVKTVTLDGFILKNKLNNFGLIKIDVEGAELDVLEGSKRILKKHHIPILIEFNRPRAELAGHSTRALYNFLVSYKYKAYRLKNNTLVRVGESEVSRIYNENVLFL